MVKYARIKRELDQRGIPLPDFDLLIAATAIATDRALITRNRRHFDRIPGLRIY
jgi:predicted nucleic acid-binding protein